MQSLLFTGFHQLSRILRSTFVTKFLAEVPVIISLAVIEGELLGIWYSVLIPAFRVCPRKALSF